MNKEKNCILSSIYHDTAAQKWLPYSFNSSCNWRLRTCWSSHTWLELLFLTARETDIHKYFYYNSAHTHILCMQCIHIEQFLWSIIFCLAFSLLLCKGFVFEKKLNNIDQKSLYGKIPLLPFVNFLIKAPCFAVFSLHICIYIYIYTHTYVHMDMCMYIYRYKSYAKINFLGEC